MGKHHKRYLFEVSLKKKKPRDHSGQIGIIPKPECFGGDFEGDSPTQGDRSQPAGTGRLKRKMPQ